MKKAEIKIGMFVAEKNHGGSIRKNNKIRKEEGIK